MSLHVVINITVQLHIANDAHLIGRAEDKDQDPPPANHIHVAAGHVRVGQSGYESKKRDNNSITMKKDSRFMKILI